MYEYYERLKTYAIYIYVLYKKLARLELEYKTKTKEYEDTIELINKLKKQGRIKSSQRKLIDFNTEKYKKRMEKEFRKFQREQEKLDLAVQQKMNKLEDLNEKQSKIDRLNQKIVSLEEKKKTVSDFGKARIDGKKSKLEARRERIEKAKKRLEEKIGRIDLSQQYQTSFNDNFAYSI